MDDLSLEDWRYVYTAVAARLDRTRPTRQEGLPSKEFSELDKQLSFFLIKKAFPTQTKE